MLNDYADGLLGEELKAAVDTHLASCCSCREEFEHLRSVREKIGRLHRWSAPPGFLQSVHHRIESEQRQRFSFRKSFGIVRVVVPAGVAALATAAIAFIFVLNVTGPRREMQEMVPMDRPESLEEREAASMEAPELAAGADPPEEDEYKKEQKGGPDLKAATVQDKALDEEAYASIPAKRAEPERGQSEPPTITLLLYKEKSGTSDREAFGDEARVGGMKSRTVEKAAAEEGAVSYMAEEPAVEGTAAEESPAPWETSGTMYSSIEQMVLGAGGRVLSIEYGEKGEIPQSVVVEIPIHEVDRFIDDLMQYGETSLPGEVILPGELRSGTYRSLATDDVKSYAIRISFE